MIDPPWTKGSVCSESSADWLPEERTEKKELHELFDGFQLNNSGMGSRSRGRRVLRLEAAASAIIRRSSSHYQQQLSVKHAGVACTLFMVVSMPSAAAFQNSQGFNHWWLHWMCINPWRLSIWLWIVLSTRIPCRRNTKLLQTCIYKTRKWHTTLSCDTRCSICVAELLGSGCEVPSSWIVADSLGCIVSFELQGEWLCLSSLAAACAQSCQQINKVHYCTPSRMWMHAEGQRAIYHCVCQATRFWRWLCDGCRGTRRALALSTWGSDPPRFVNPHSGSQPPPQKSPRYSVFPRTSYMLVCKNTIFVLCQGLKSPFPIGVGACNHILGLPFLGSGWFQEHIVEVGALKTVYRLLQSKSGSGVGYVPSAVFFSTEWNSKSALWTSR